MATMEDKKTSYNVIAVIDNNNNNNNNNSNNNEELPNASPILSGSLQPMKVDTDVSTTATNTFGNDNNSSASKQSYKYEQPQQGKGSDNPNNDDIQIEWIKGEVQPSLYRDIWFALIFVVHLMVVVCVAIRLGPLWLSDNENDIGTNNQYDNNNNNNNEKEVEEENGIVPFSFVLFLFLVIMISSPILSILAFHVMFHNADKLIRFSLQFSIVISGMLAIVSILVAPIGALFWILWTIILVYYSKSVWDRIPYAAANLRSAVTAIKANLGVTFVSLGGVPILVVFYIVWLIALMGTTNSDFFQAQIVVSIDDGSSYEQTYDDYGSEDETTISPLGTLVIFLFLLSLYWTHQVVKNTTRTTVAGVVGSWWFSPIEASGCWSSGVYDSFTRSVTYSFGSICFGSLIVAIIHVLRDIVRSTARNRRAGIFACIAQCVLIYIERLVEYFNKWAFLYIGLYGYSYLEAGKNVFRLFRTRGWSTIISDNLVNRMLGIICFVIGLLVGFLALIVSWLYEEVDNQVGILGPAFFFGFIIGFVMASIVMGVISSAVDAIIVCFAEAPREFKENHPLLSHEMETAWKAAWPTMNFNGLAVVTLGAGPGIV